jgi:hypothetical protein
MPGKATKTEILQRVEAILRIRLDGAQFHDVVQYAAENGWNLRSRRLRQYIRAADKLLAKRLETDREKVIALHLSARRALYARCVNAADYRTALSVLSDEAKLLGLYPAPTPPTPTEPTKVEVVIKETVVDSRDQSDAASGDGGRGSPPQPDTTGVPPK